MIYEYKIEGRRMGRPKPLLYSINESGCWINESHACDKDGYGKIQYNKKTYRLHRFVYELENKVILKENEILRHTCDNPRCFNPNHLIIGTVQENINDRQERQHTARNENHGQAKLTNEQVIQIYKDNRVQVDIAKDYNISQRLVSLIKRKELHKDLLKNL